MSADQTATELTTRDVLSQVDRRLTLIEEDLRSLDEKLDDKVDGLDAKLDHKIDGLRSELTAKLDSHLKWTLGTMISLTGLTLTVFGLMVVFLKL